MFKTLNLCAMFLVSSFSLAFAGTEASNSNALNDIADSDVTRINSAKTVRAYSQKVPALACFLFNDIDPEENSVLLGSANAQIELILAALRNGDDSLGILNAEDRQKTLERISTTDEIWKDVSEAVTVLLEDPSNEAAIAALKGRNKELFEVTDLLVTEISGQYANPNTIDKSNAWRMNIVSRASATTQKIAKNLCMAVTYPDDPQFTADLADAAQVYETSLRALRDGMPELGVKAAPTPEIAAKLDDALNSWNRQKPGVDTIIETQTASKDAKRTLFAGMLENMEIMQDVALAYKDYAKYDH